MEGGVWGGEEGFGVGRDRWKTLTASGVLLCTKGFPYEGVDPPDSSWPGQTRPARAKRCGLVRKGGRRMLGANLWISIAGIARLGCLDSCINVPWILAVEEVSRGDTDYPDYQRA